MNPEHEAQRTRDLAWDGTFPIDAAVLAARLRVQKDGQALPIKMERALDLGDYSGSAALVSESGKQPFFLCLYNGWEPAYRQLFTKAHELGHVVMGHVSGNVPVLRDKTFNDWDPKEAEANAYAAELIMPADYVRFQATKIADISGLASFFGVSPTAIRIRLKNLGLL